MREVIARPPKADEPLYGLHIAGDGAAPEDPGQNHGGDDLFDSFYEKPWPLTGATTDVP